MDGDASSALVVSVAGLIVALLSAAIIGAWRWSIGNLRIQTVLIEQVLAIKLDQKESSDLAKEVARTRLQEYERFGAMDARVTALDKRVDENARRCDERVGRE